MCSSRKVFLEVAPVSTSVYLKMHSRPFPRQKSIFTNFWVTSRTPRSELCRDSKHCHQPPKLRISHQAELADVSSRASPPVLGGGHVFLAMTTLAIPSKPVRSRSMIRLWQNACGNIMQEVASVPSCSFSTCKRFVAQVKLGESTFGFSPRKAGSFALFPLLTHSCGSEVERGEER